MDKVNIIVPLNNFDESVSTLLSDALKSIVVNDVKKCTVTFIGPSTVTSDAKELYNSLKIPYTLKTITNNNTDIFVQINKAVSNCTAPYFSILEYDDQYTKNIFKNFEEYSKSMVGVSIYIPLNEILDATNATIVSFYNETPWVNSLAEELGFLTGEILETQMDFNLTGAIFKTDDFISIGGLKPSLKIASWYEMLLRMAYNNKAMYVIPKVGYIHKINRNGSYSETQKEVISQEEGQWLINTARQEYFFKEDREKTFEKDSNNTEKE